MHQFLLILLIIFTTRLGAQQTTASNELSLYFDQPDVLKKAGVKGVRCIFRDSRKLLWFGTENGLFRFDGTNIVYKRHKQGDTTSIPNNVIISLAEDKQGNIWIGTLGGIACMNPYNFRCRIYTEELHTLPNGNFDNKLLIDPSGNVWTGNSDGIFLLNRKENKFKKVWRSVLENKPLSGYVNSLLYWEKDTLVASTFNDLVLINIKDFGFRRIAPLKKDILCGSLCIDAGHRLWIGTWGEGCIISDSTLTRFRQYKWEKDLPSGVDNIATSFCEVISANAHDMWVAGGWALSKIPISDRSGVAELAQSSIYKTSQNQKNNDPANIGNLLFDGNCIWTGGAGTVAKFSADKNVFQTLPLSITGAVGNIQPVEVGGKKYVAISTWHSSQGIIFWNPATGATKIINSIAKGDSYGSNISAVATDKYHRLWLSSLAGTYILNDKFQVSYDLSKAKNKSDIPSSRKANDLLISNDTAWIACYKNGIDLYDMNFRKLKHFSDSDHSGLKDNLNNRFFKDSRGNIWICGNKWFYRYLPATAGFRHYEFGIDHSSYGPYDVAELSDGHLVIATETTGLIYFDPRTEKFERISPTSLLEKEESIESVTTDVYGNVWYLTTGHLVEYQPASKKIYFVRRRGWIGCKWFAIGTMF